MQAALTSSAVRPAGLQAVRPAAQRPRVARAVVCRCATCGLILGQQHWQGGSQRPITGDSSSPAYPAGRSGLQPLLHRSCASVQPSGMCEARQRAVGLAEPGERGLPPLAA